MFREESRSVPIEEGEVYDVTTLPNGDGVPALSVDDTTLLKDEVCGSSDITDE